MHLTREPVEPASESHKKLEAAEMCLRNVRREDTNVQAELYGLQPSLRSQLDAFSVSASEVAKIQPVVLKSGLTADDFMATYEKNRSNR